MQSSRWVVRSLALKVLSLSGWLMFTVLSFYAAIVSVLASQGWLPFALIRHLATHPGFRITIWLGAVIFGALAANLSVNAFGRAMMGAATVFAVGLGITYEFAAGVPDGTIAVLALATAFLSEAIALVVVGLKAGRRWRRWRRR